MTPGLSLYPPALLHQPHLILRASFSHPEIRRNPVGSLLLWLPWDPKETDQYPLTTGVNWGLEETHWGSISTTWLSRALCHDQSPFLNLGIRKKDDPMMCSHGGSLTPAGQREGKVQEQGLRLRLLFTPARCPGHPSSASSSLQTLCTPYVTYSIPLNPPTNLVRWDLLVSYIFKAYCLYFLID